MLPTDMALKTDPGKKKSEKVNKKNDVCISSLSLVSNSRKSFFSFCITRSIYVDVHACIHKYAYVLCVCERERERERV